jgi:DNA-binding SARP family transcriptional activator
MPRFIATLFGRFRVEREDRQQVEVIEANKVKELLGYLLVYRERPQPRETLAELLWADQPPEKSKKNLRQTLWKLKSALQAADLQGDPPILAESDWIQVNPSAGWWLDVAEFEQAFAAVKNKRAREMEVDDFLTLQRTSELYRGNFLDGWYQDWCLFERERYQTMYLMLLNKTIQYCEVHQHYETGLAYGEKLLFYDRAYERAHRQMMRLYYHSGDRTRALRQYERCALALREELGIEPSERTVELYEQIRADRLRPASIPAGSVTARSTPAMTNNFAVPMDQFAGSPAAINNEARLFNDRLHTG